MSTPLSFSLLHTAIKEQVSLEGAFSYQETSGWFNLEYGVFPEALRGSSFTIKIDNQGDSEYESSGWRRLYITVEFCLDGLHDKYLAQLPNVVSALQDIATADQERIKVINTDDLGNFSTVYLQDKVLITSTPIVLEVLIT